MFVIVMILICTIVKIELVTIVMTMMLKMVT